MIDTPAWMGPYSDWYLARDHHGADPEALEIAFRMGFAGKSRVDHQLYAQVAAKERSEVRAAFVAGRAAKKGASRA